MFDEIVAQFAQVYLQQPQKTQQPWPQGVLVPGLAFDVGFIVDLQLRLQLKSQLQMK